MIAPHLLHGLYRHFGHFHTGKCLAWYFPFWGLGSPQPALHGGYAHGLHHVPGVALACNGLEQLAHVFGARLAFWTQARQTPALVAAVLFVRCDTLTALSHWMQTPWRAVQLVGLASHFLQRARRSSLVLFRRLFSAGLKSLRVLIFIFLPMSQRAQAKRSVFRQFLQYPDFWAGFVAQNAQNVGVSGSTAGSGASNSYRHRRHTASIPWATTANHASRVDAL